jgi:quercetin dioxygenase-like cupin family protein
MRRSKVIGLHSMEVQMRKQLAATVAIMTFIAVSVLGFTAAFADEEATPVLKQALPDNMEANIVLIEAGPGFETERHIHPGHVFVYVLEGAVELDVDGEDPVRVSAGEAVYEQPNKPMVGRNVSSTEDVRLIVFQVGEAGKPLQIDQPK